MSMQHLVGSKCKFRIRNWQSNTTEKMSIIFLLLGSAQCCKDMILISKSKRFLYFPANIKVSLDYRRRCNDFSNTLVQLSSTGMYMRNQPMFP